MNKIKKALDVLSGDFDNQIIKADMIKVLREQFTILENSFDASCNHNTELQGVINYLDAKINSAMCCHENAVQTLLTEAKERMHLDT